MDDIKYEFVSGNDLFDVCTYNNNVDIRFYQICQFKNQNNMYAIRSYLFEGKNGQSCVFQFEIKEKIDYELSERDLKKFIKVIKNTKNTNKLKIKYITYPYVSFTTIPPPSGNELSIACSDLLK
jgi:hypothetical protein